jgi:hypothetical protein
MLSKIYHFLTGKIQALELNISEIIRKRLTLSDSSGLFYLSAVYFNLKLMAFEIFADLVKFLVIVFADPAQGFKLFYSQRDLQACPYSYSGFRQVQKRLRTFSFASFSSLVAATVIVSLIMNLTFGGRMPSQAASFGWRQSGWTGGASTVSTATHANDGLLGHPDDRNGWNKYYAKDANVVATTSIALTTYAATTSKTETNLIQFSSGTSTSGTAGVGGSGDGSFVFPCQYDHGGNAWEPTNGDGWDQDATAAIAISGIHCNISNFTIASGKTVYVKAYDGANYGSVVIYAGSSTITGSLDASGKGYRGLSGLKGEGPGGGLPSSGGNGGGGGYGGTGATGLNSAAGGAPYGSSTAPNQMGSAGGSYSGQIPGFGGGYIRMNITGALTVNGSVKSNGTGNGNYNGGGAGGSIWISANSVAGSGSVNANGGAICCGGGGGAGGRIAFDNYVSFTLPTANVTVNPGSGGSPVAGAGTRYGNGSPLALGESAVKIASCQDADRKAGIAASADTEQPIVRKLLFFVLGINTAHAATGEFISGTIDTGLGSKYVSVAMTSLKAGADAGITFRLASRDTDSPNISDWTFYGPSASTTDVYSSSSAITSEHNNKRFIRYKVIFNYTTNEPHMNDITLNYSVTQYPSSNLAGLYHLDGNIGSGSLPTGAAITDSSGNNNSGLVVNANGAGMASQAGKIDQAMNFDGVDDYVNVGNGTSFNVGNSLTIEAWINPSNLSGRRTIFSTMANTLPGSFELEVGTGNGGVNRVGVITPSVWNAETNNNAISTSTWQHIVYTRDGVSAGNQKIYVNGILQPLITDTPVTFLDNASPKLIGARTASAQRFAGMIDEVAVYNRALTQAEVTSRFNSGNPSKITAGKTLSSSWYDTTDPKNLLSQVSWSETGTTTTNVKLQIRTAAESLESPGSPSTSTASSTAFIGPDGTVNSYYSASSTGCSRNNGLVTCDIPMSMPIADGYDDQWMQYQISLDSDGGNTPSADDINLKYVVNNPPAIETGSFIASQATTSAGLIEIGYSVLDSDTESGNNHPGKVEIALEYRDGSNWVAASSSLLAHSAGSSTVDVSTSTYATYGIVWNAGQEAALAGRFIQNLELRLTVNDGEPANNFGHATTTVLFDAKNPVIGPTNQPMTIDSRPAPGQPATVYFDQLDDSPLYYKIGGDETLAGISGWTPYTSTTSIDFASLGTTSAYVVFKDEYENYSSVFRVVQTETPSNMVIRDLTNADVGKYMEFVAWKAITSYNGSFKTYQIWRGEATGAVEPESYQLIGTTTLNQVSKNYFFDESVLPGITYYYRVAAEDMNGNLSMFGAIVKDNPDGQGGTDNTPPAISNVEIIASSTQSVTIAWDTDELASSYLGYSRNPGDFSTVVGYDTMVDKATTSGGAMGRHVVTISGLAPQTIYYYQVKSVDPGSNTGALSTDPGNNNAELQFTTKPGPQISEVKVDYTQLTNTSVAVKWLTDLDSDSVVVYSVNPDLDSPAEIRGLTGTTTSHEVKLDNLLPRTVYYFYVKSSRTVDGLVEEAYDKNVDEQGIIRYYSFETAFDQEAPLISTPSCQLTVTDGTTTPALIITGTTSEPAVIHFAYGLATSTYDAEQATTTNHNIDQVVLIDNLLASTTYHFQISAVDKSGNERVSEDFFCSTGEQLATQEELKNAYKAGQNKGAEEGLAEGKAQQTGGGTLIIDKTDKAAPIIARIQINHLTATSALISWITNEASDGLLKYGLGGSLTESVGDDDLTISHEFRIKNLEPKSDYRYLVSSADSFGNLAKSTSLSFTTPDYTPAEAELIASTTQAETREDKESLLKSVAEKAIEVFSSLSSQVSLGSFQSTIFSQYDALDKLAQIIPAPVLGGEPATEITPTTVTISWKTDKPANSMVAYAPEGLYAPSKGSRGYLQLVGEPNRSATDHTVRIVGLKPDSLYHYQLRSKAKIGIEATSRDFVFRTKPEALEIISINTETLASDQAKFNWLTSQETDTELTYTPYRSGKLSPDEIKIFKEKTLTTTHEAVIKDLEAGVIYEFVIGATGKKGVRINKTISFFSTTKDDLPPEINDIQTESALSQGKDAKVQTIITWTTSEPTISKIKYANGVFDDSDQLNEETAMETSYSRKHTLVITKFAIGEVYTFRILAQDSGGNQTISSPHIVLAPKQKEGVFELIINTFESTFGWLGQMK